MSAKDGAVRRRAPRFRQWCIDELARLDECAFVDQPRYASWLRAMLGGNGGDDGGASDFPWRANYRSIMSYLRWSHANGATIECFSAAWRASGRECVPFCATCSAVFVDECTCIDCARCGDGVAHWAAAECFFCKVAFCRQCLDDIVCDQCANEGLFEESSAPESVASERSAFERSAPESVASERSAFERSAPESVAP